MVMGCRLQVQGGKSIYRRALNSSAHAPRPYMSTRRQEEVPNLFSPTPYRANLNPVSLDIPTEQFQGHIYEYVHVCMYIYVCMYMYVCVHVCICMYVYVCMFVCLYLCMHICMYAYMHAYIHACMCMCVCARAHETNKLRLTPASPLPPSCARTHAIKLQQTGFGDAKSVPGRCQWWI